MRGQSKAGWPYKPADPSPVRSHDRSHLLSRAAVGQESFINSDTNLDSWQVLEELRALVEAEQLRMLAIPKVFELHEIDDALAVRSLLDCDF